MLLTDSFVFYAFNEKNQLVGTQRFEDVRYSERDLLDQQVAKAGFLKQWAELHFTVMGGPAWFVQENLDAPVPAFPGVALQDVRTDILTKPESAIAYSVTSHQRSFMEAMSGNKPVALSHTVTRFHSFFNTGEPTLLLLHFEEGHCCIYARKEGLLTFFNGFEVATSRDVLYFALAAMKEAGLSAGHDKVYVSGGIDLKSPLFQTLSYYLQALPITLPESSSRQPENQSKGEPHTWFLHHCVLTCAS